MNEVQSFRHNTAVTTSYDAYHSYVTSAISTDTQKYVVLSADSSSGEKDGFSAAKIPVLKSRSMAKVAMKKVNPLDFLFMFPPHIINIIVIFIKA